MKGDELNKKVSEELKYIPRGLFNQNMLREYYNDMRRHDLSLNPAFPTKNSLPSELGKGSEEELNYTNDPLLLEVDCENASVDF